MVVHFEYAALARGAMMGAIRLLGLTLVAEAHAAVRGLHRKRGVLHSASFCCGQVAVAIVEAQRRAGICKDGGSVAPVEHEVEEDTERGREFSCVGVNKQSLCALRPSQWHKATSHGALWRSGIDRRHAPVQTFWEGTKPMPASTHTAHEVSPYTNSSGK